MGLPDPIRIDGLREFRTALRRVDRALPKRIKDVGNAAAQIVVDEAKPRVPRRTGRAAASIRAASTAKAVRVAAGGKRVPYFAWLDFGGKVGRNNTATRTFYSEGRYVWSAFSDRRADVERALTDGMTELARDAGMGSS
ncbi:HK97 gp10 family phage protein [Pseudonocardia hydrocarbonoxydans]|uniref:HK97 gp10 family phage protein n=1 Tax=Pseudonocardia hydrocarbonoxydans TaxID=76726 RepID=A0A4Y3WR53_9PSEU|nr:HK97 gp10 family phage protein [Pseudonocardia hydrocarbonoxydans]GEC20978.1 hypothetical protein PHY01_32610 [Pseudonocardia hydrocarbonoxydans]